MSVVRQLAQAVLLLVPPGCAARLVATAISNCPQRQDATVDIQPMGCGTSEAAKCSRRRRP